MNKTIKKYLLPGLTILASVLGFALRLMFLLLFRDDRGLLPMLHPLNFIILALTAAILVALFLLARKLDGKLPYKRLFPASMAGGIGYLLAAVGLLVTSVLQLMGCKVGDVLTLLTGILGLVCVPCLLVCGYFRWKGLRPNFLFHVLVTVYFMVRFLGQYRVWSGCSQFQDYGFRLFAMVFLMLTCYHRSEMGETSPRRARFVFCNQAAVYFCALSLADGVDIPFYLGMLCWMATDLCSVRPVRRQKPTPPVQETPDETA